MRDPKRAGWLRRWGLRKAETTKAAAPEPGLDGELPARPLRAPPPLAAGAAPSPARMEPPSPPPADAAGTEPAPPDPGLPPEALPPVESLTYESDFTPYLSPTVAEAMRIQALRQLWRSNPLLANLDGLNDYDEDFSTVGKLPEVVKTAYRVGRGLLASEPEAVGDAGTDRAEVRTDAAASVENLPPAAAPAVEAPAGPAPPAAPAAAREGPPRSGSAS